jgi:salicyloyl-CoA 5-hydroxylase
MSIRIACVGGGPGGLFFSALMKQLMPDAEVTLFERNRAEDAFGFGVVFSDATLQRIDNADPVLHDALAVHGVHWDAIEVWLKGERLRFAGNGMAAVHRRVLLSLLQDRAGEVGVDLRFETFRDDLDSLRREYDLVVAADGTNSPIREQLAPHLGTAVETATAKFIWFGTTYMFDGLTFVHAAGPHGTFAVHGYPISDELSTFIVETDEATWRTAGLDAFDVSQPPGPSDQASQAYLEDLFADQIAGHKLVANNSRWGSFRTRRTRTWHHENVVLLGDAVHTAHFSVGSGTRMAMEDAVTLATEIAANADDLATAVDVYESQRQPEVAKIQNSARPSLSWWEHFGAYHHALEPWQFAFHFFSRSIPAGKLRQRDPAFVAAAENAWHSKYGAAPLASALRLDGATLPSRLLRLRNVTGSTTRPAGSDGTADATAMLVADDSDQIPLVTSGRPITADGGVRAGVLVAAPDEEAGLSADLADLDRVLAGRPSVVVVHGGTRLTRVLLSEAARLHRDAVSVIVEPVEDLDRALTDVLSGRADAVAVPESAAYAGSVRAGGR